MSITMKKSTVLALGLLMTGMVSAQVQWNGSTSHDWFLPQNWTPFGVPRGGDVDIDVAVPRSTIVSGRSTANLNVLRLGVTNQGFLWIEDGTVSSVDGILGLAAGTVGHVALTGPNASWNVSSHIKIGAGGWGGLGLEDGASVTSHISTIGYSRSGEGRVEVVGQGSSWDAGTELVVGLQGQGVLGVAGGAELDSVNSWVGQDGGLGVVAVAGAGSVWNNSGTVVVGTTGAFGDVILQSGAELVSEQAIIGGGGGGGRVSFQFGSSSWSNSGDVIIGSFGSGTVDVNATSVAQVGGAMTVGGGSDWSGVLHVGGELEASGGVSVVQRGRLQGKGHVDAAVSIGAGGVLSPGRDHANQGGIQPGTLTVASLELLPGAELRFELDAPGVIGSDINDLVIVHGDLALDGVLNVDDAGNFEAGTYTLLTYAGTLVDNGLQVGTMPPLMSGEIDTSVTGEVRLVATSERVFQDNFQDHSE